MREWTKEQASEKITLAHVEATSRLVVWEGEGHIYNKKVPHFVISIFVNGQAYTKAEDESVEPGEWFFNHKSATVYINLLEGEPSESKIVAGYRLFFATAPLTLSADLTDNGPQVFYHGRIQSSPGYNHRLGIDQNLVSLVGSGRLALENTDGGLNGPYERLVFENQPVRIYSWTRRDKYSSARIIYRGQIESKTYDSDSVSFTIKDRLFAMLGSLPQETFTENMEVLDDVVGLPKRRIYGKVAGVKLRSINVAGSGGIPLTGLISGSIDDESITGSGTEFLSELSQGDQINVGSFSYTIKKVSSNTSLETSQQIELTFSEQPATVLPIIPLTLKNRVFQVSEHACSSLVKTYQLGGFGTRVRLNNLVGVREGDLLYFESVDEFRRVTGIFGDNDIRLESQLPTEPDVGSIVRRAPIDVVKIEGVKLPAEKYDVNNTTEGCTITIAADAEFSIARQERLSFSLSFTASSRTIGGPSGVDLTNYFRPRDWILAPNNIWYEVLSVDEEEEELQVRTTYSGSTQAFAPFVKRPTYVGDTTEVSATVNGKTRNGEPEGEWIRTAADVMQDVMDDLGLESADENFEEARLASNRLISMALPLNPDNGLIKAKAVIDLVSASTGTILTLNNDLEVVAKAATAAVTRVLTEISDRDVLDWSVRSVSGQMVRNVVVQYRPSDTETSPARQASSEFIKLQVGTNNTEEVLMYIFDGSEAQIAAHRYLFNRQRSRTDLTVTTDLRFEDLEIGSRALISFEKLFKRTGGESPLRIMTVVGKKVTGERIEFLMTDFGNIYNISAIITDNDADGYVAASDRERLINGYITDGEGVVEDDDNSIGTNLIS